MYRKIEFAFGPRGLLLQKPREVTDQDLSASGFWFRTGGGSTPSVVIERVPLGRYEPRCNDPYSGLTVVCMILYPTVRIGRGYAEILGFEQPALVAGGVMLRPYGRNSKPKRGRDYFTPEERDYWPEPRSDWSLVNTFLGTWRQVIRLS